MKRIIKFISFLLILIIFTISSVCGEELSLNSMSAVLIDGENNRVLYGKDEENKMAMASTTKIMTCIIALEYGKLDNIVLVSKNAAKQPKVRLGVKENQQYVLEDLLYAMMLESYNDVSVVVAENVAGSVEKFAEYMNKKAKEIGANNTNFVTPNGLDAPNHCSTAKDMAIIGAYAIKNKKFVDIINTKSYSFRELTTGNKITAYNKDTYLSINKNAIGIKTGYTNDAGYCFVGACKYNEKQLVSCVLGCGWPPNSTYKWKDTTKLMEYGNENFEYKQIYNKNTNIKIELDKAEKEEVKGQISKDIYCLLDDKDVVNIVVNKSIDLPITKGEKIGKLEIWINEEKIYNEDIYAIENIEKNKFIAFLKRFLQWFKD